MQGWIAHVLESPQLTLAVLPAAFLLGLLAAASSCCTVPALGAIAGYSSTREGTDRRGAVLAGLFFMIGTVVALAALGGVAGFVSKMAGSALGRYWKIFAGLAMILFGLAALNLVPFRLPTIGFSKIARREGLLGAALFGLAVGGSTTACTAGCNPVLPVALGVATLQGHTLLGAVMLGAFAVGFSAPLTAILLGLSLGRSTLTAQKVTTVVRVIGGVMLVGVGFYLLVTV